jgi:hypothetical protein
MKSTDDNLKNENNNGIREQFEVFVYIFFSSFPFWLGLRRSKRKKEERKTVEIVGLWG